MTLLTNTDLQENIIATKVIGICIEVHKSLGPGLLESVYEEVLAYEFDQTGMFYKRQQGIPVVHKEVKLELGFRADFIIENKVILEIKSIEALAPVHLKQVLTYLRLTDLKLGLLINFNEDLLRDGLKRISNNLK